MKNAARRSDNAMHEKRFNHNIERLRDPDRLARLEVDRVVSSVLENQEDINTVLDIGTGSGVFAGKFVKRGLQVTGLDANPDMLPVARQFVPEGTFREGTAEHLPFPDGSFDLVFMGLVLHETDDTLAAIKEAYRVAVKHLAVLEWPYEEQSFGPPLSDRLSPETVDQYAQQAGFSAVKKIRLENVILYLLDK